MKNSLYSILFLSIALAACTNNKERKIIEVISPDEKIVVNFNPSDSGLVYSVYYRGQELISTSRMGFKFSEMEPIGNNLRIKDFELNSMNQSWEQPWGEQKQIRDHHNRLLVKLQEKGENGRKLNIEFRVFNDGLGFRYLLPEQEGIDSIKITDELTEFSFPDNNTTWFIPAYHGKRYELLYSEEKINGLDTAHTPLTIRTPGGIYLSIHEAALLDYASMTLYGNRLNTLKCDLAPWKDGIKVKKDGAFTTPWRTIQISDKPGGLIESNLILNLNEPNKLGDVSWVKPMKYLGIWWGIHIDKWTFHQGPRLGATTQNALDYIDFAAKHGFNEVLVEGWNEGFEADWNRNFGPKQNFTTPTPYFDLFRVQEYAKSKGISLQAYNESCANTENYLSQIDSAFELFEKLGYRSVKVGQVNTKFRNGEWHYGQFGVNYYQTVVNKGAQHHLAINFHEPVKGTGLRRTYPNLVSREGARGQEYNAWDAEGGNPPEHLTILPFTRMLAGPMDFTPGIFRIDIPQRANNQVNTTLAKQLAIYVVIYSPIQMAADLIENYDGHPAFQFIKDVPTDWETSRVLDSEIGDYIIIVRKDINSEDWYLGGLTDENSRTFRIGLSFLEPGEYNAQIYQDNKSSDYESNPMDYEIISKRVSASDSLELNFARSGGTAIRFRKL